jgi:2-isopropylmalate synthase
MFANGVDPGLDFRDLRRVRDVYERCTRMEVHPRHPYGGDLVFTAFSGSHQDAIKKGMDLRGDDPAAPWEVPYLLIDPRDIGRNYEAIVRINSQSGKGGVAYVMSRDFGFEMPKSMQPSMGLLINRIADERGRELTANEIYEAFSREFLERRTPLEVVHTKFNYSNGGEHDLECAAEVSFDGESIRIEGRGNGPIDAFVHAMDARGWKDFQLTDFHEHSIGTGSETEAVAYVEIETSDGKRHWGAGMDTNIDLAGIKALTSAFNRAHA